MPLTRAAFVVAILLATTSGAQEIVVKAEKSESEKSDLLRPPGDSASTGSSSSSKAPVDWASLPPWKKTEFFGIRAQGKTFIYVVDCSGSMGQRERLTRAKREIRRGVADMRFPQRFHVIFYNDRPRNMPGGGPQGVDLESKEHLNRWLSTIDADGDTDPREAMTQALALKPDAVFLLSDGEFPAGVVESISRKNTGKVPVHCVGLSGKGTDLKKIAKESGGEYVSRP